MSAKHRGRPGPQRDQAGRLNLAGVDLEQLLVQGLETPCYAYDLGAMKDAARTALAALAPESGLVAYAMKANSAGTILRAFANEGMGADVVSGAELELARRAGIPVDRIVMSGVAKTDGELDSAIGAGILALQLEAVAEIERVAARARALGKCARISLRVNPSVQIDSHAHIATGHDKAKFGIAVADLNHARNQIRNAHDAVELVGLSSHIGSMLSEPGPYLNAADRLCTIAKDFLEDGAALSFLDCGGGFGIDYGTKPTAPISEFVKPTRELLNRRGLGQLRLIIEPGRWLVGASGILLSRVVGVKQSGERRWLMVDAGMNDLLRPALYQARHQIEPLATSSQLQSYRVVGPVCESADDFGDYELPNPPPSALAFREAGAYGFTMASEYNGRPLPGELFLEAGRVVKRSPSPGRDSWITRRLNA